MLNTVISSPLTPGIMVLSIIRRALVDSLYITSKLFILPNESWIPCIIATKKSYTDMLPSSSKLF